MTGLSVRVTVSNYFPDFLKLSTNPGKKKRLYSFDPSSKPYLQDTNYSPLEFIKEIEKPADL